MKKRLQSAAVGLLVALAGVVAFVGSPATPASAEPTGQYVSYCIGSDGRSHEWRTQYYKCNGWIDRYINGNRVAHLDYRKHYAEYQRGRPGVTVSVDCVVGGGFVVLGLATGGVGWVSVSIGLASLGWSCRNPA